MLKFSNFTFLIWSSLIATQIYLGYCQEDYWSDDFDTGHQCENPEEIVKLSNMNHCKYVRFKSDEQALRLCKTHLTSLLQKKCEQSRVKNPGELLYCNKRGALTCCFANESCETWTNIQTSIHMNAKEYLMDRNNVLNNLVKLSGYKTCHHLDSLDASKCANDCKKLEKGEFAKNCKSTGGLFKCCIRRDKRSCHECRYCCTLTMCTRPPGRFAKR